MTVDEIKNRITLESLFQHFRSDSDPSGKNWRCLFPERHNHGDAKRSVTFFHDRATCHSQGCFKDDDLFAVVGKVERLPDFRDQKRWVEESFNLNGMAKKSIDKIHDYTDEKGTLLFQTVRYTPKDFSQRQPDGNGDWIWNLKNTRLVLYRLPDVLKAEAVLILEGEKDCEAAYTLGLPSGWAATCNPMGAGKWRPEYSECLTGKTVVSCADADEAGQRHGAQVAQSLHGLAKEIRWLTLPYGKDLSEWIERGGTQEQLAELLEAAETWEPTTYVPKDPSKLTFTSLADLLSEPDEKNLMVS